MAGKELSQNRLVRVYIKCSQLWGQGGVGAGARPDHAVLGVLLPRALQMGKARPGELRLTRQNVQFKAMNRRCK